MHQTKYFGLSTFFNHSCIFFHSFAQIIGSLLYTVYLSPSSNPYPILYISTSNDLTETTANLSCGSLIDQMLDSFFQISQPLFEVKIIFFMISQNVHSVTCFLNVLCMLFIKCCYFLVLNVSH
jgi:hypothetical protein